MRAERVDLSTPDGPMPVYEAVPDGPARGAVLVLQDIFGVSPYLEDVCRRLAALGWHALAPSLYHRTGASAIAFDAMADGFPHSKAMTATGILADADACFARFAGAGIDVDHTAVTGFCMGGTLTWFLAVERRPAAAVTFYGHLAETSWPGVTPAMDSVEVLTVPWLGLFGDRDAMIPVEEVEALRALLDGHPTPAEIVRYPDADHAFHRDLTPDWYHEASAIDAWARTLAWFDAYVPAVDSVAAAGVGE